MKNFLLRFSIVYGAALFTIVTIGQEWTRFRGPNGTGIASADTVPTEWTAQDYNWKVALPGTGHSSPVLWGDTIFLTSSDEPSGEILVFAVDANDGSVLWKRGFPLAPFSMHKFNSFASSSPAVDSERVYLCWTTPERYTLMALDHDGKTVWDRDLGPFKSQHGGGTSPIVYKDKVILANEQDGQSFLIAVDARTGKTHWQSSRRNTTANYSTPCIYQPAGEKPLMIFNSHAHGISAVDPETGELAWEYAKAFNRRSVSSPVIAGGVIFGSCGSGGGGNYVVAVRPGDPKSGKPAELAYELRRSAPYVPTGVAFGDLVFLWSDGGIVSCVHAPTGDVKYQERVGGNYFGSPVLIDRRIFNISTAGEVVVIQASDQFKVLARNALNETTHTTPAVAHGRMYIRTFSHLMSIGGPKAPEAAGR